VRRLILLALLVSAGSLSAQSSSFWDSSVRAAPQVFAYEIREPLNQRVTEMAFPLFVIVPITSQFSFDIGSAYAIVNMERDAVDGSGNPIVVKSDLSGLTDTQLRANYTFGQDLVVLTAGLNIPTGSSTVAPEELEAATLIGSDFLTFPVSGFGSGLGFTGGIAVARPFGSWNLGFGASLRHSSEYEPGFRNSSGASLKFQPGVEYRARIGADHPFGTGRVSLGFTFSKFGDDQADTSVYNTGDRYIAQLGVSNSIRRVDYIVSLWNLFRAGGTLIDQSPAARDNITNAMLALGIRSGPVVVEPSVESRFWMRQGESMSVLGTAGLRFTVNRGNWAIIPGAAYSVGNLAVATESAAITGYRATLALRLGR
jgi:hypothetical protein